MEVRLLLESNVGLSRSTLARISIFFSAASLSGAFSGLLAFGIVNLHGRGGKPGWAWIFILEGLFTCLFGAASFFLLPRSPAHIKFLTEAEREYVVAALKEGGALDRDEKADTFSWSEVGAAFKLPQVWILAVVLFMSGKHSVFEGMANNHSMMFLERHGSLRPCIVSIEGILRA